MRDVLSLAPSAAPGVIALGALLGGAWLARPPPRAVGFVVAGAALAAPLLVSDARVVGTEGVLDMATPGLLLALAAAAARGRARLLAFACLLVAAEELDWGQRLWFFPTPDAVRALPSRSTDLNFHNLRGFDVVWQPLPLLLLVLSAARARLPARLHGALLGAGVPAVVPALGPVLIALGAATLLLAGRVGERPADEAFELASVWALLVGWEGGARPGPEPSTRV